MAPGFCAKGLAPEKTLKVGFRCKSQRLMDIPSFAAVILRGA